MKTLIIQKLTEIVNNLDKTPNGVDFYKLSGEMH